MKKLPKLAEQITFYKIKGVELEELAKFFLLLHKARIIDILDTKNEWYDDSITITVLSSFNFVYNNDLKRLLHGQRILWPTSRKQSLYLRNKLPNHECLKGYRCYEEDLIKKEKSWHQFTNNSFKRPNNDKPHRR